MAASPACDRSFWSPRMAAGRARVAGEEHQQALLQVVQGALETASGETRDAVVGGELEAREAAVGGDVLVLLADGLAEHVDLDVAGLLGQRAGGDVLALEGVDRPQQAHGERARGAEPGPRGDVGHADTISRAGPDRVPLEAPRGRSRCSISSTACARSSWST